jgi:hypothetical protein
MPQCISYGDALSSDDHRIILQCCAARRLLLLVAAVALSHAVFLAAYRQVTVELTGTPEGRLDWPALRMDGRTARRLARAGHRRYSGGVLLSILTFHKCTLLKELHQAASTTRRTTQQFGAVATRGAQHETWPDTDETVWRSSLLLWISSGVRTRSYSGWATNVSTQNFQNSLPQST